MVREIARTSAPPLLRICAAVPDLSRQSEDAERDLAVANHTERVLDDLHGVALEQPPKGLDCGAENLAQSGLRSPLKHPTNL